MKENQNLYKQVFDYNSFKSTVDTSFSELINTRNNLTSSIDTDINSRIINFFNEYESLFYIINKNGTSNSHEYLVLKSSEYINHEQSNSDVQDLLDEILSLRTELLELKKNQANV